MRTRLPLVEPLERALYLRSLEAFGTLGSEELAVFAQFMTERFFPARSLLWEDGDPPRAVHLLVEGRVRLEKDGRRIGVREAPAGFGLVSLLADAETPRAAAETDVVSLVMDGSAFLEIMEDHFPVFLHVRSILARQVAGLRQERGIYYSGTRTDVEPGPWLEGPLPYVERLLRLRRCAVFQGLGLNVLAGLARDDHEERFEPGAVLWERGDPGDRLLVIAHGIVVGAPEEPGRSFRAGPGAAVGIDAAFSAMSYEFRATAETRVVAIRIDAPVLMDVMEDNPDFAMGVLRFYAREQLRLEIVDRMSG
jgi:CRP-like cAMP-binding protein